MTWNTINKIVSIFFLINLLQVLLLSFISAQDKKQKLLSGTSYGSFMHFDHVPNALFFEGKIKKNDTFEFRRALRLHEIDTLVLSSPGGNVFEALNIAGIVFDKNLITYIPKGEECASACSFLYFAGDKKYSKGRLGVHQFFSSNSKKVARKGDVELTSQFTVSEIIGFLNEFGTPPFVYERMFSTTADNMYIFSKDEMQKINSATKSEKIESTFNKVETFLDETLKLALEREQKKKEKEIAKQKNKLLLVEKEHEKKSVQTEIQKELNRIGCTLGQADGKIGPRSKSALDRFNKLNKSNFKADKFFLDKKNVEYLKKKSKNFCPSNTVERAVLMDGVLWKGKRLCTRIAGHEDTNFLIEEISNEKLRIIYGPKNPKHIHRTYHTGAFKNPEDFFLNSKDVYKSSIEADGLKYNWSVKRIGDDELFIKMRPYDLVGVALNIITFDSVGCVFELKRQNMSCKIYKPSGSKCRKIK